MADRNEEPDVGRFGRGVVSGASSESDCLIDVRLTPNSVIPSGAIVCEANDAESRDLLFAWSGSKAGPSTRELIRQADQFTWSG